MFKFKVTALSDMPAPQAFLTQEETLCYDSFKIVKRKNDWALGRYVLKTLMAENFDIKNLKDIEVLKHADGMPIVKVNGKEIKDLSCSISHSNAVGAAAITQSGKIGIDIEKIEPRSKAWAEFSFYHTEYNAQSTPEFLTELWAKKEAVVKFMEIGLTVGLHEIRFEGGALNFYAKTAEKWKQMGSPKILLNIYKHTPDFIIALAHSANK